MELNSRVRSCIDMRSVPRFQVEGDLQQKDYGPRYGVRCKLGGGAVVGLACYQEQAIEEL